MRAPLDHYPDVLSDIIRAVLDDDASRAASAMAEIAFSPMERRKERWPARSVIAGIYQRDRYQCRYCGERVILVPVMRLLARLYPVEFPYHQNWKADSTHPAFISRGATLDHVMPIAEGGDPVDPGNLVTACWGCNRRKGDLIVDELGWKLLDPFDPDWRGLTEYYEPLWVAAGRPALSEDEQSWMHLVAP